jgi:hypothetical protein
MISFCRQYEDTLHDLTITPKWLAYGNPKRFLFDQAEFAKFSDQRLYHPCYLRKPPDNTPLGVTVSVKGAVTGYKVCNKLEFAVYIITSFLHRID